MLKSLYYISMIAIGIMCYGCNHEGKTADEVAGDWNGSPEKIADPSSVSTTVIDTYSFERDDSANGGTVTVACLLSTERVLPQTPDVMEPVTYTATGSVSVSGTWDVTGDGEVTILLDDNTLQVSVDPDGVELVENMFDQQTSAKMDSIKPGLEAAVSADFRRIGRQRIFAVRNIDDIRVKDLTMTAKINGIECVLRQQGAQQ